MNLKNLRISNYQELTVLLLDVDMIAKYKNIINARGNKKMEGVSFNEE